MRRFAYVVMVAAAVACGNEGRDSGDASAAATMTGATAATTTSSGTTGEPTSTATATSTSASTSGPNPTEAGSDATSSSSGSSGTTSGNKFDVGLDTTTGPPIDMCKVQDDMNAIGECGEQAQPDSFEPEIQWAWAGNAGEVYSVVTPLVANLTDDNNDGEIDLCDVPDIVVVASAEVGVDGHIYVLDGATGTMHFRIETTIASTTTPALGDIDGDGLPEIISALSGPGNPVAFEHDGSLKWQSDTPWNGYYIAALALADLDNDGDVEIVAGDQVYDHNGVHLWQAAGGAPQYSATAAADLDGDGDLEVVIGHSAFHHDGSMYYVAPVEPGFPQIANLDADPEPEVLITSPSGLTLLEHTGAVKYQNLRPTGDPPGDLVWYRPATVQDFDGDDIADFAVSSGNNYTTYHGDASILWKAVVSDITGIAAGTAFDFLGDGIAEAMYADEHFMFVFDGSGQALLQIARSSLTGTEYPIVADVDNDGSAEIVVVSNMYGNETAPTVQVIRDKRDRWIQARRIWNQHTYHVTKMDHVA